MSHRHLAASRNLSRFCDGMRIAYAFTRDRAARSGAMGETTMTADKYTVECDDGYGGAR